MKIKILMENKAVDESFACDHGLCIYVETAGHRVLVDAGPDRRFEENAVRMGVDISEIDTVILSHGHYDHSGGLVQFFSMNDKATVYAAEGYDLPHYDANGAYIGVEPALVENPRIISLKGDLTIDDELKIIGFKNNRLVEPINTCGMTEGMFDGFRKVSIYPETFRHEQYLLVTEGEKSVLFSGCSHRGIVNIANWAKDLAPSAIVGGFHLMGVKSENFHVLDRIAEELLKIPADYYTGHCTGADQFAYLKEKMGDRLIYAATGAGFEI